MTGTGLRVSNIGDISEVNYTLGAVTMSRFRFTVHDTFNIAGRGPVVMGKVESGAVWVGQSLVCSGAKGPRNVRVVHIEKFKQDDLRSVKAGPDDVGLELEGVTFDDVKRQDVLTST
jgi:translation elongation factor EF-Tu-like GTPase